MHGIRMEVKYKEMARVAVIILNWNGEKLLREFLPSVVKHTDPGLGRIVVADNASEDDSVRILGQDFPKVELIRFSKNHGFAGGYNRAVGLVPEEIVVLLNSDVEVAPGWLEPLVALLDEDAGIAAVQHKIWLIRTGIISSMRGLAEGLSTPWVSRFAGDGF